MSDWFKKRAPIRQKLLVVFGLLIAMMVVAGVGGLAGPVASASISLGTVVVAILFCLYFHAAITGPYVTTVVRMEALAAGDLTSPVEFTDYSDCVGRMTKAMLTFRDAAVLQQRQATEQAEVVHLLGESLASVAAGDLTAEVRVEVPASFAELKTNFNDALQSLRELIGSVIESATTIRVGSNEIAQASEDLARRTESNAANLEETSAAITQIDDRLRETAASAARTVHRADQAIATVVSGRAVADEAVQAMGRVADSAKGIDSVIEGLDKIAFQTRVLAMNAAVEAGRAGDAGRGFAVVADLVSALAMRAEEEAKRARDQLTVTQAEIVTAVQSVEKVDGALANISGDVDEVHTLLDQMATDNHSQASSIAEISTAVGAMDHATQQNAAMVEQTSAAARNLSNEVESMSETASRFQIGGAGGPGRPAATKARRASAAPKHASVPLPVAAHRNGADHGNDTWNAF